MRKGRGVYHRRRASRNVLFPTSKEKYLSATFVHNEDVILRIVFLNENLCNCENIWSYAKEALAETGIKIGFAMMSKDDYMICSALDRFNNGGPANFVPVKSEAQFVYVIDQVAIASEALQQDAESSSKMVMDYDIATGVPIYYPDKPNFYPDISQEEINLSFQ